MGCMRVEFVRGVRGTPDSLAQVGLKNVCHVNGLTGCPGWPG